MPEHSLESSAAGRGEGHRRGLDRRLCVAPMMDWTDRHFRSLIRIVAPRALLYTEMVVDAAVEHGERERLLGFDPAERPVALQLGGSDPACLARAARVGERYGYDEVNLNIGCPSGRVQAGRFGACLMAEPGRVAGCVSAIRAQVRLPVTVKTRIGIDDHDSYGFLRQFAAAVIEAGADALIVHARKAWLKGLSPRQNREVPELDYDRVRRLKSEFADTPVIVNGGIDDADAMSRHLEDFDGVMIGRAAYHNPMVLGQMQQRLDPKFQPLDRAQVLRRYLPYIRRETGRGVPLHSITRHMMGLYQGQPGARRWRQRMSGMASAPEDGMKFLETIVAGEADAA